MDIPRYVLGVVLAGFLVGCKIDISVPQGGLVTSESGTYRCEAGEDCLIDVADALFDETFTAVPDPGFQFAGWRQERGFLCGGSDEPCHFSTQIVSAIPSWLVALQSDFTLTLEPQFICADGPISIFDPCVGSFITINGQVPTPNAAITAQVGTYRSEAMADELGRFSLQIRDTNPDHLVKLRASATHPETGAALEYVGLIGPVSGLSSNQNYSLDSISTAHYVLLTDANAGREPVTFREMRAAESNISPDELLFRASALELLGDGSGFDLPEGTDSGINLISDKTAVDGFINLVEAAEPGLLGATIDRLVENSPTAFTEDSIAERVFLLSRAPLGSPAIQGRVMEFDAATLTGVELNRQFVFKEAGRPFTWALEDGRLELVHQDANLFTSLSFGSGSPGLTEEQAAALDSEQEARGERVVLTVATDLISTSVTRIYDGVQSDVVQIAETIRLSYEPVVLYATSGEILQPPAYSYVQVRRALWQAQADIAPLPFSTDCAVNDNKVCPLGTWAGRLLYGGDDTGLGADITRILVDVINIDGAQGSGTLTGAISELELPWRVEDGKLVIEYPDGWTQTVTLLAKTDDEYRVFQEFVNGERRIGDYETYVHSDTAPPVAVNTFLNRAGRYWKEKPEARVLAAAGSTNAFGPLSMPLVSSISFTRWEIGGAADSPSGYSHAPFYFDQDRDGVIDSVLVRRELSWELESGSLRVDRLGRDDEATFQLYWYPIASSTKQGRRQLYVVWVEYVNGNTRTMGPRVAHLEEQAIPTDWDFVQSEYPVFGNPAFNPFGIFAQNSP